MSRLTRRISDEDSERGAVVVLVVIVLGLGVMLGMGALVVDVGGMYAERAQLQNGADAGAMAVAIGCGTGTATCGTASRAGALADSNANDKMAAVDNVCGRDAGGALPPCPAAAPGCADTPGSSVTYAQVQTSTRTRSGGTVLPSDFGKALLGSGYQGKQVHACAQVSWAPVGATTSLSVTVSLCSWNQGTSDGTVFAPQGPYSAWPAGYSGTPPAPGMPGGEQVLMLHGSGNDCAGGPSGWQLPGGFGWLDDPSNNCTVFIDVNGEYPDRTGVPVKPDCLDRLQTARTNHTVLYFPVYDGVNGTGGNGSYHLKGIAAFVLTGGNINGSTGGFREKSVITSKAYCTGSDRCLYGFFTQALLPPGSIPGGTNFGTSVARTIG